MADLSADDVRRRLARGILGHDELAEGGTIDGVDDGVPVRYLERLGEDAARDLLGLVVLQVGEVLGDVF